MESNLLVSAKKFEKESKWVEAIENIEELMNQSKGYCDAEVYILYARCLRKISKTNRAKEFLTKGLEQHPNNEEILFEFLNLNDSLYDWKSSEQIALSLININSDKSNYHFRLGRIYAYLHKSKEAEQAYKTGLKHKHQISFEKLKEKIQSSFTDNPSNVISEYTFVYGKNNLGIFTHKFGDKKFFTKISKLTGTAKREETFYKKICADFPHLNQIAPSYIDSKVIDKIMYLTIEMIDGDMPNKTEHTKKIIKASSQISKIRYQDIIKKYPNPNYIFQFEDRPTSIFRLFTQIHKEYINKNLFSSFNELLEGTKYPKVASTIIQKLESLIMDNKLYLFIKPEAHYSLLQGDLIKSNIKIKKENENPIIFDWATFTIGPNFMDLANYLSSMFIPYSEINSLYLSNNERKESLSLIEKIFFLYALTILYIAQPSVRNMEIRLSDFIIPAMNDLEVLVSQFKDEEFGQVIESLSIGNNEAQIKKNELNKQIQTLKKEKQTQKKENQNLQTKFNNLINSKSWKVTAPFRKLIELMKKNKQK